MRHYEPAKFVYKLNFTLRVLHAKKAEEYLHSLSQKGLHLFDMGYFISAFLKGEPEDLQYRLVEKPLHPDQLEAAIGLFADAGWTNIPNKTGVLVFVSPPGTELPEFMRLEGTPDYPFRIKANAKISAIVFAVLTLLFLLGAAFILAAPYLLADTDYTSPVMYFFFGCVWLFIISLIGFILEYGKYKRQLKGIRPTARKADPLYRSQLKKIYYISYFILLMLMNIVMIKSTNPILIYPHDSDTVCYFRASEVAKVKSPEKSIGDEYPFVSYSNLFFDRQVEVSFAAEYPLPDNDVNQAGVAISVTTKYYRTYLPLIPRAQYNILLQRQRAADDPQAADFGLDACFASDGQYCGLKGGLICILEVSAVQGLEPLDISAYRVDDESIFTLMSKKMDIFNESVEPRRL